MQFKKRKKRKDASSYHNFRTIYQYFFTWSEPCSLNNELWLHYGFLRAHELHAANTLCLDTSDQWNYQTGYSGTMELLDNNSNNNNFALHAHTLFIENTQKERNAYDAALGL